MLNTEQMYQEKDKMPGFLKTDGQIKWTFITT